MSISVELFSKHGEKACVLDTNSHREATALWYLWNAATRILIRDKKVSGCTIRTKPSSAESFWAVCATKVSNMTSELRFSPWTVLKNSSIKDPMEMLMTVLHIAAHEIGHHLALQKYGKLNGKGHGRGWQLVMDDVFEIRGKRIISGGYCNTQVPQFKNRQEILWDLYDLYLLWRLEGADWNHPLCKKLLGY